VKDEQSLPNGVKQLSKGLLVEHAQLYHTGNYTCMSTGKNGIIRATAQVYIAGKLAAESSV